MTIDDAFQTDDTFLDDDGFVPPARPRKLPVATALLLLCTTAGVGVIGGIAIQKHWGGAPSSGGAFADGRLAAVGSGAGSAAAAAGANGRQGAGGSGATGASGFAGAGTIGTVKAIDGTALYVTDTQGNVVKITTDAASIVSVTKPGSVKDIEPGDRVVVQGSRSATGYKATTISVGGAGGAGFGGRGGLGGRGGSAAGGGFGGGGTEAPSGFGGGG